MDTAQVKSEGVKKAKESPPDGTTAHQYLADLCAGIDRGKPTEALGLNGDLHIMELVYDSFKSSSSKDFLSALAILERNYPIIQRLRAAGIKRIFPASEYIERPPLKHLDTDKIIQENGTVLIAGQPGSGKSLWLSQLGELSERMPVMLIAAEAQGGIPDRLRALQKGQGKPLSSQFFVHDGAVNLRDTGAVMSFIELAKPLNLKVLAIDTYAACTVGMDENNTTDTTVVIENIQLIKRELGGCSVLIVHHTTKDGQNYRGSSALHGHVDGMHFITEDEGHVTLTCQKSRETERGESRYYRIVQFVTRQHPETGEDVTSVTLMPSDKVVDTSGQKLSGNQRKVLEALDGFPQGVRFGTLRDATGLAKTSLLAAIRKLIKAGYVNQSVQGEPYYITTQGIEAVQNV